MKIGTVEMKGITKGFPGVLANDHIDFDVHAGEIHALLGENGAGKTTLMKILYGMYRPDAGEIFVNGTRVHLNSPLDAISLGIGMVHQHFMLVPTFTVVENVALGLRSSRKFVLDLDRVGARLKELSQAYGLRVNPHAKIWQLSVGEQQRVEILKALYRGASLLILDEPTAVLTPQEADELFDILKRMANEGHAIIFISHKLNEVLSLSDRITVLRDGRVVQPLPTSQASKEILARLMVGREILFQIRRPHVNPGDTCLALEDVWALEDEGLPALRGINLEVHAGEILGIAGVSGNGQKELAEVIVGLRKPTRGKIKMDGMDVTGWPPARLINLGLSYIPEERMLDGGIREFSIQENLVLKDHVYQPFSRRLFLNFKEINRWTEKLIQEFDIRAPSQHTSMKSLSGGNIQKLILARELGRNPHILVAAQPTRGLDIGATEYVRQRLVEQKTKGTAILLISDDLEEILALSDRIAAIYEGQIMGITSAEEANVEELGLMMAGVRRETETNQR
jgi:simple sugar transport system ATP-binding protein